MGHLSSLWISGRGRSMGIVWCLSVGACRVMGDNSAGGVLNSVHLFSEVKLALKVRLVSAFHDSESCGLPAGVSLL